MARDQSAYPIFKVGQRTKAIVQPIGIIEGFERSSELGGRNRGSTIPFYHASQTVAPSVVSDLHRLSPWREIGRRTR
jgi:hypothetical protein